MKSELRKGDIVRVYEDPSLGKKLEGKARLIRWEGLKDAPEDGGNEHWTVLFIFDSTGRRCRDEARVQRWIRPGDLVCRIGRR